VTINTLARHVIYSRLVVNLKYAHASYPYGFIMPKKETGFRGTSLKADLVAAIEQFIKQHPEAGYKSVSDFVQESTRLRIQELRKSYASHPRNASR